MISVVLQLSSCGPPGAPDFPGTEPVSRPRSRAQLPESFTRTIKKRKLWGLKTQAINPARNWFIQKTKKNNQKNLNKDNTHNFRFLHDESWRVRIDPNIGKIVPQWFASLPNLAEPRGPCPSPTPGPQGQEMKTSSRDPAPVPMEGQGSKQNPQPHNPREAPLEKIRARHKRIPSGVREIIRRATDPRRPLPPWGIR